MKEVTGTQEVDVKLHVLLFQKPEKNKQRRIYEKSRCRVYDGPSFAWTFLIVKLFHFSNTVFVESPSDCVPNWTRLLNNWSTKIDPFKPIVAFLWDIGKQY